MAEMPLWVWIFFAIGALGFLMRHPMLLLGLPVLALSVALTFIVGPLLAMLIMGFHAIFFALIFSESAVYISPLRTPPPLRSALPVVQKPVPAWAWCIPWIVFASMLVLTSIPVIDRLTRQ